MQSTRVPNTAIIVKRVVNDARIVFLARSKLTGLGRIIKPVDPFRFFLRRTLCEKHKILFDPFSAGLTTAPEPAFCDILISSFDAYFSKSFSVKCRRADPFPGAYLGILVWMRKSCPSICFRCERSLTASGRRLDKKE